MALIGTIRKNGWILIATMVLALGGFILMDIVSNTQRYGAGDVNSLGNVNGKEIKRSEFDNYEKLVYTNAQGNSYQIRTQVWDYFVQEAVISQEAEDAGLGVSKDELLDLQFGEIISPVIVERFKDASGQPNRAMLQNVKQSIEAGTFTDPMNRAYWAVQEKEVIKKRLEDKLMTVVSKGMYTPAWMAEMAFKEGNERLDFRYVAVPYDRVKDTEVSVTDGDFEKYLDENPHLYDQTEETRVLAYAEFTVVATSQDSANARTAGAALLDGFRNDKSDSTYVFANNGTIDGDFKRKAQLPFTMADTLSSRPVGSIVGPYLDMSEWKITKILDRKVLPDSVRARHILIRNAQDPASKSTIDSLKTLVESGKARFDSLAVKVSQDPGSGAKGGDLGWFPEGAMVKEFNDVCFMTGEQGKLYAVSTQFGWHLIEITGKKFIKSEASVKVATIGRKIEPSKNTQQSAKDKALAVLQAVKKIEDFVSAGGQQGFFIQNSPMLKENDYNVGNLGSGEDAREMVRWAFNEKTKLGDVSPELFVFRDQTGGYFDSKYVVAALRTIVPEGKASLATLKSLQDAETKVRNVVKGKYIAEKIGGNQDFAAIAAQWNARQDTVRNVSFLQTQAGEPRIQGTLFTLTAGQVSKPIVGNSGVYLISPVTDRTQVQTPSDLTMFRRQVSSTAVVNVRSNLMKSLVKNAELRDNRARFF
ncbi:MAG: peptidylprolyl isomerase [Bacteroidota bacterium]